MIDVRLMKGDCLERMKEIEDNSIDMVLADLPYGTTDCKWDFIIPLKPMWEYLKQVVKSLNSAIVLFSNEPFTSILITSNLEGFKYRWDWNKKIPSGTGYAKYRPMQQTEDICVFTKSGQKTKYNPQKTRREISMKAGGNNIPTDVYGGFKTMVKRGEYNKTYTHKNPTTLIEFDKVRRGGLIPTQKPIALIEYLIKTYTDEGDVVLDFCMGSGTTGCACANINRNFIGIELSEKDNGCFELAEKKVKAYQKRKTLGLLT